MARSAKRRDDRLEVRLAPRQKSLLKRAADFEEKTVSAFVLDKSLEAAAETLADRRSFVLTTRQYDAFVTALDATPKSRPRLEQLFAEPSVLE